MSYQSELEQRILSELEEAGDDAFETLLNSTADRSGTSDQMDQFVEGLRNLLRGGLVRIAVAANSDGPLVELSSTAALDHLDTVKPAFKLDESKGRWKDIRRTGPPYPRPSPIVVSTDSGYNAAQDIVSRRGYEWWRVKPPIVQPE